MMTIKNKNVFSNLIDYVYQLTGFLSVGLVHFLTFLLLSNFSFGQTTTTFTTTGAGTWTVPTCVGSATVEVWGAGGGGGDGNSAFCCQTTNGGSGGGGGGYSVYTLSVTADSTYAYNVGVGGNGDDGTNQGEDGGNSWFSSTGTVIAYGGGGGLYNGDGGGGGGIGNTTNGNDGGNGNGAGGGDGGTGGNGTGAADGSNNGDGDDGTFPGGGGGGGNDNDSDYGGDGAHGQIRITYSTLAVTIATNDPAPTASDMCTDALQRSIHEFTLTSDGSGVDFTNLNFTTSGTYTASDVDKFQLWYSTTNNLSSASQLSTDITTSLEAGTHSFSGIAQTLSIDTYYYWITTDVSSSPINGATIQVSAIGTSEITTSCGDKFLTTSAGPTHTFSSSSVAASADAGGTSNTGMDESLVLSGSVVGGSATAGTWSIISSSPAISGSGHSLGYTSETSEPDTVTFFPETGYAGTVTLRLTSNGCTETADRTIEVVDTEPASVSTSGTYTWTPPCGVTTATVQVWGAGGGGGDGNSAFCCQTTDGGGGGGGGGYSTTTLAVSSDSTYTYYIGAGGVGDDGTNEGTAGEDSWFGSTSTVIAYGGSGGTYNGGGTAAGGNGNTTNGDDGSDGSTNSGGNGGDGGNGGNGGNGSNSGNGDNGESAGGGGGGGNDDDSDYGGNGADGQVTISLGTIVHPSATAGSDIHACHVSGASNITTGSSASDYDVISWTTVDGNGSFTNSSSLTTATYQPSSIDNDVDSIYIRLTASFSNGCDSRSDVKKYYVYSDSAWIGGVSSAWENNSNWCSTEPTTSTSIRVPSYAVNQPSITNSGEVCNNILIDAGATLSTTSSGLSVSGDWTNNGTLDYNTQTISFVGTGDQSISGDNALSFYNLEINNTGGSGSDNIILNQAVTVANTVTLTDGIINTDASNILTLSNNSNTAINNGSSGSFVSGPLSWNLNSGASYFFPVGVAPSSIMPVSLSDLTGPTYFTIQYHNNGYGNESVTGLLENASTLEYWDINEVDANVDANVTLYWADADASEINSCNASGDLVVAHFNGSNWETLSNEGGITGGCGTGQSGSVTALSVRSFSPFSFGSGSGGLNPLPIELLSFTTVFNGEFVELKWQTASEINNDYFTIERSEDGSNFTIIEDYILSKSVNGISTTTLSYDTEDNDTEHGTYYYRLKQTDYDGKFEYSAVTAVVITEGNGRKSSLKIFPNPNNGNSITVVVSANEYDDVLIQIHDLIGRTVFQQEDFASSTGTNTFLIDFYTRLETGLYIVTTTINNETMSQRLVVE